MSAELIATDRPGNRMQNRIIRICKFPGRPDCAWSYMKTLIWLGTTQLPSIHRMCSIFGRSRGCNDPTVS